MRLVVKVPQKEMHGYEAAYKLEKQAEKHKDEESAFAKYAFWSCHAL